LNGFAVPPEIAAAHETIAGASRCSSAMASGTGNQRLIELVDELQSILDELRSRLDAEPGPDRSDAKAVEAFADEAFRARDA
jgi:hypothetical protein